LSKNNKILNPAARDALDKFKYEVADELGLMNKIKKFDWGNMTTREVGKIGGNMVKKMVKMAEDKMQNINPDK